MNHNPCRCAILAGLLALLLSGAGCKPGKPGAATGAAAGGNAVRVVAVPARIAPVQEIVPLVGSVTPNESVEIKAETDGLVKEIGFNEGDTIDAGTLLVALDETKLAAALSESEANLKLSEANFARAEQLLRDKLISQQEFDQTSATFTMMRSLVELRRRTLRDTRIYAPFRGTVAARLVSPGQVISRNTTLTMLVDLETVKVELSVPERYLGQIRPGQTISFAVDAYPGQKFSGTVFFVSPQLDAATRTALVKARVPNPDRRLRGGMFAKLDLEVRLRDAALVIPEPAIVANGDNTLVFVVDARTNAVMKPVKVGLRLAGKAEITQGLSAGELVVVEGAQKLRPGAPVILAPPERAAAYQ